MHYFIISGSWIAYLLLHSLLAADVVKAKVRELSSWFFMFYRLCYVLISTAGLLLLVFQLMITPAVSLWPVPVFLKYAGMVMASWGVICVVVAFRQISGWAFLGLKRAESMPMIQDGIHAYVRHPIYLGVLLIITGFFVFHPTDMVLLVLVIILLYIPAGIWHEEKRLLREYGDSYRSYKARVPAIFPFRKWW